MHSPASHNQMQAASESDGCADGAMNGDLEGGYDGIRTASRVSAVSAATFIIAIALVILISVHWSGIAPIKDGNPPILLILGILASAVMIGAKTYRKYWRHRDQVAREIERIGPYILREKLGSGGMGEVFLAEHQLMKRQCAVKLIHPEQARNREMRNSFEREAKATAQLTHWNTVEVYDYGTSEDGRFYYVMEYLRGVNLWEYVEQYGPMEPGRVVYILRQLCDALYEADCAGLVHRDIKPSNVFLTERGRSFDVAKLLDFGLVQAVTSTPIKIRNVSKKLMGSPSFMCPEQAVGLTPDCRGDLYSLGAVAYFLLTGRPPFVDENPIMLIVAHATTNVPTFDQIGVDVPEDLSEIILRCLARDPSARFDSARDLLMALENCNCNHEWTWQTAESWWAKYEPGKKASNATVTLTAEDTQTMERADDQNTGEIAASPIDYDEPTAIYEPHENLSCP